ncbi:MAG: hypothetical protein J3Q66DRAFT_357572 [Benniella sp.]|nr:MAG: hypothetical protein J3Q66DRAFT_357572 [Benniella sp.]
MVQRRAGYLVAASSINHCYRGLLVLKRLLGTYPLTMRSIETIPVCTVVLLIVVISFLPFKKKRREVSRTL